MKYLVYPLLALLLTQVVGPSETEPDSEKLQKLFSVLKQHLGDCPKEHHEVIFFTCPSHMWPEIIGNFVPLAKNLEAWTKQRIKTSDLFWYRFSHEQRATIVKYSPEELVELRDGVLAWALLNRYLEFKGFFSDIHRHLSSTLNALTDADMERVSRLPYGGNIDRFEEFNRLVNDTGKARLLDGMKRATRNDFEMSNMLVSLHRWSGRSFDEAKSEIIHEARDSSYIKGMSIEQLRTRTLPVPNFRGDPELAGAFIIRNTFTLYRELDENKAFLEKELPQSFSGRDHVIKVLTRLADETRGNGSCRSSLRLESGVKPGDPGSATYWDEVLSSNVCMMQGVASIPDEFFEEYSKLQEDEKYRLGDLLLEVGLPYLLF